MGHRKWVKARSWREFHADDMIAEHNALYDAWVVEGDRADDLLKDRNAIQQKLDAARKCIAELESPARVPFSDDQIERMARAAYTARMRREEKSRCWDEIQLMSKDAWRQGIRAALAAGGLEPCTVPTGHVLRDRLVEAEAKIERQRKNLRQLYEARERDAQLIADLRAEVDEDNAAAASVNDLLIQVQNLTAERDALRERASVPVPAGDTPDDQVEALARVLQCAYSDECGGKKQFEDWPAGVRDGFRAEARAAIAHLSKRPEGLPTRDELRAIMDKNILIYPGWCTWQHIEAVVDALRPWLRDPAGFELDVTAEEALRVYANGGKSIGGMHNTLDLCRAVARDAYMAALGGLCAKGELSVTMTAEGAAILAIETVRRWDSFLAAVDAEGGE